MQVLPRIVRRANGQPFCTTEYIAAERWLRTTWQGFVSPADAEQGAQAAVEPLPISDVHYLLNDNSQLQGSWFDSIEWLQQVWAPQAAQLGIRYVAHVLQPHSEAELTSVLDQNPFAGQFELQLFSTVEEATAWLRDCRRQQELSAGIVVAQTAPNQSAAA
jgi:hypothetical protein